MGTSQAARLKHRPKQIRTFECPICGDRLVVPKYLGFTPLGHIKTMWCYRCKEVRDFIQIA